MRYNEFVTEEQKLDEILPLIPMAAGFAARKVGGALVKKAAQSVGKKALDTAKDAAKKAVATKAVGMAARGAAGLAKKAIGQDKEQEPPADPNAVVGTQPATPKTEPMGAAEPAQSAAQSNTGRSAPTATASSELRTGATVDLPTKTPGGKKAFKVTRAQGDDIEIEDPQAKPGEPKRMVYKKDDLEAAMNQ